MDFVKKNLGLLICAAVGFILACILMFFMFKTAGQMKKQKEKVQEQMTFFDRVAREGYKLTAGKGEELENLLQAQKNYDEAERFYHSSRDYLAKNYSIEPELPLTSPDALKMINEKVRQMTDFVLKNDIYFPGLCKEFMSIVGRGSISSSEFAPVFRQLMIYDYLLKKIAESGIKEILRMEWPLGFAVQDEDIYSITPIRISVHCEMEQAQAFLNAMSGDQKLLFYIKNVTLVGPEKYSAVISDYQASVDASARQQPMGNEPGGEFPGEPGGAPMRGAGVRRTIPAGDRMMANPAGGDTESPASRRFVVPDPKRQDYLAFAKKYVTLDVRFDLYEFKKLEEK